MQTASPPVQENLIRPDSSAIISVRNASKRFGKAEPTLKNLSFEVKRGSIFCLLGPSGSGKSTTMRLLNGVYKPSEGEVWVLGQQPHQFSKKVRSKFGYMPQQFVLFPELSTRENMNFVASVYGMNWFGRQKKVQQALEFTDLWEARHRLASQLSGGMQRRLELASTLVHRPELIFVDEPTAGIDPVLRAKFWDHFKTLRDEGRTIFVTTQYVTEADYCDVVAILNQGRLLALGTPEEIRENVMGGEIINLTLEEVTSQVIRILRGIQGIRHIQILSTEDIRLTVEKASDTLQHLVSVFQENNIPITTIEPYKPNFEEVFVQLMESTPDGGEEEISAKNGKDKEKPKTPPPGQFPDNGPASQNPGQQIPNQAVQPPGQAPVAQSLQGPKAYPGYSPFDGVNAAPNQPYPMVQQPNFVSPGPERAVQSPPSSRQFPDATAKNSENSLENGFRQPGPPTGNYASPVNEAAPEPKREITQPLKINTAQKDRQSHSGEEKA